MYRFTIRRDPVIVNPIEAIPDYAGMPLPFGPLRFKTSTVPLSAQGMDVAQIVRVACATPDRV